MPDRAPIWTQVGVTALGLPTIRIEIRVTAIVPSQTPPIELYRQHSDLDVVVQLIFLTFILS
jgi:hypothetical protein